MVMIIFKRSFDYHVSVIKTLIMQLCGRILHCIFLPYVD